MAIAQTINLTGLDRGERIALAAAYQRAARRVRGWDGEVEAAVEELLKAVLAGDDEVSLTVEEVDLANGRLARLVREPRHEAPELVAIANKVVELL
jgi:hypothetical protein